MKIERREFLRYLPISAFTLPNILSAENSLDVKKLIKKRSTINPKRLRAGSRIGIVEPASPITPSDFESISKKLQDLDLVAIPSKNLFKRFGYLAGIDNERINDLHEMFLRKDIDGILCARGGYGTPRILKYLDYELIKRNPKIIIGYSDITSLLISVYQKTELVTFHGPVGISNFNDFSKKYFKKILFLGADYIEFISEPKINSDSNENNYNSIEGILKIFPGRNEEILMGGNLLLLISLIGTEFDFDLNEKIFFLEEVREEPYRTDKMLTQLINSNKFKNCRGVVLGKFSNCEVKKENPSFSESLNLRELLIDRLGQLGIPVIYGLSFGHIKNKFTLPIGVRAMIDVDREKFVLIENAVTLLIKN